MSYLFDFGFDFIVDKRYNETPIFNEDTIKTYKFPFGEMAREMLELN